MVKSIKKTGNVKKNSKKTTKTEEYTTKKKTMTKQTRKSIIQVIVLFFWIIILLLAVSVGYTIGNNHAVEEIEQEMEHFFNDLFQFSVIACIFQASNNMGLSMGMNPLMIEELCVCGYNVGYENTEEFTTTCLEPFINNNNLITEV